MEGEEVEEYSSEEIVEENKYSKRQGEHQKAPLTFLNPYPGSAHLPVFYRGLTVKFYRN
jgi:hypothetical protein